MRACAVGDLVMSPYRARWIVEGKDLGSRPSLTSDFVGRWPCGNERLRIKTSLWVIRDSDGTRDGEADPKPQQLIVFWHILCNPTKTIWFTIYIYQPYHTHKHTTVYCRHLYKVTTTYKYIVLLKKEKNNRKDAFKGVTCARLLNYSIRTDCSNSSHFPHSAAVKVVSTSPNRCLFFASVHIHCMQRVSITHEEWGDAVRTQQFKEHTCTPPNRLYWSNWIFWPFQPTVGL